MYTVLIQAAKMEIPDRYARGVGRPEWSVGGTAGGIMVRTGFGTVLVVMLVATHAHGQIEAPESFIVVADLTGDGVVPASGGASTGTCAMTVSWLNVLETCVMLHDEGRNPNETISFIGGHCLVPAVQSARLRLGADPGLYDRWPEAACEGMSRALLKLSGNLVHDYATISDDSPSPNRASRARRAATSAGIS